MEFSIQTKGEYDAAMKAIHELMNKGEDNLTDKERSAVFRMAVAVERFEDLLQGKEVFAPGIFEATNHT